MLGAGSGEVAGRCGRLLRGSHLEPGMTPEQFPEHSPWSPHHRQAETGKRPLLAQSAPHHLPVLRPRPRRGPRPAPLLCDRHVLRQAALSARLVDVGKRLSPLALAYIHSVLKSALEHVRLQRDAVDLLGRTLGKPSKVVTDPDDGDDPPLRAAPVRRRCRQPLPSRRSEGPRRDVRRGLPLWLTWPIRDIFTDYVPVARRSQCEPRQPSPH